MGIILTGIINKTKNTDVRTRASSTNGIAATGVVSSVDSIKNTISVDQLFFVSSPNKGMGSWTVTPPITFNLDSITSGNNISITIDPTTLAITTHTLTAKEIKKK